MKVKALYVRNKKTGEMEFTASGGEHFNFEDMAEELRAHNEEVSIRMFPCLSMVTDIIDEGIPS